MPLVASVESPPNNGNWALFKVRLGSAGSRAAESESRARPLLGPHGPQWAKNQTRPDLRAREAGLAPGPGATSKSAGPAPASAATGQLPIRTSGLPIKPKIQCTQPCTTDFPENMGDLTEEMANATAQ